MRKLGLVAAASLAVLPCITDANAADTGAKVYYKEGTRIETADVDMKINLQIQPRFTFSDADEGGRRDAGIDDSVGDTTSFDLRRVRIEFSGNVLDKQFSYKIKTDLRSDAGGSDLKEAWLQWNSDAANMRWGQFKAPFSRQENVSSTSLYFIDRSAVSDFFAPSYQPGAMLHGPVAEGVNYYVGAYNGQSDGEGRNRPGVDNKLAVDAALTANFGDYGSRGVEGDMRADTSSTAFTTGAAIIYGQAESETIGSDYDHFDLNVDAGMRSNGLDLQTDFFYSTADFDEVAGDAGEPDLFGFYAQGSYNLNKEWGVGARFGYFEPDEDISDIDDQEEYNLVVNYFLNGHWLKLQTGVTFEVTNFADGDDVSDFRFETQLAGYL